MRKYIVNQTIPEPFMKKLPLSFYLRDDVTLIARELIGKVLVTNWNHEYTSGRIVETEAYAGEIDSASHAFRGVTPRTKVMYGEGGKAYVYLCYVAAKPYPHHRVSRFTARGDVAVPGSEVVLLEGDDQRKCPVQSPCQARTSD